MTTRRPCDVECYSNYFLIKAYDIERKLFIDFEMFPGQPLDVDGVRMLIAMSTLITFNGNHYDIPMIAAALMGYDCATLKQLSDSIVKGNMWPWDFYRQFNIAEIPDLNHIDLFEVAPGVAVSLKLYMGRMHSPRMQECEIPFDRPVLPHERPIVNSYCGNDLLGTADLLRECKERLELREFLGKKYNINCMSKSDAQTGEAIVRSQLPFKPRPIQFEHGASFRYTAPHWIEFVTPQLRDVLVLVQRIDFVVNDLAQLDDDDQYDENGDKIKNGLLMPPELKSLVIQIGTSKYKLGKGGLHSQESSATHRTVMGNHTISDHDVASYYPSLILLMDMFPEACGPDFIPIYRGIYDERLDAKAHKEKTKAGGLKIALNGVYGKLGSKWSFLFAPQLLIRTTVSGQLAILMLIERLELFGITVLSANTDGIVLKTPCGLERARDDIMQWWQTKTGLVLEATFYTSIHSRDVNNYVAFKMDGTHKGVGVMKASGIENNKHPENDILAEAVIAYIGKNIPIEKTIRGCTDIRKFVAIQKVKGGACRATARDITGWTDEQILATAGYSLRDDKWIAPNGGAHNYRPALRLARLALITKQVKGDHVGGAIRWYRSTRRGTSLAYIESGNKVPNSDQAEPCLQLPDTMPCDVDFEWYIGEAYDLLADLGLSVNNGVPLSSMGRG